MTLLLLFACQGDINTNSDPILIISSTSVTFPPPERVGEVSSVEIELSNPGSVVVLISSVTLNENDESPEVSLIDEEDWTSETIQLVPGNTKILNLQWSPTNAVSDQGTLNLSTNAGEYTIEFVTPDLDSALNVQSNKYQRRNVHIISK